MQIPDLRNTGLSIAWIDWVTTRNLSGGTFTILNPHATIGLMTSDGDLVAMTANNTTALGSNSPFVTLEEVWTQNLYAINIRFPNTESITTANTNNAQMAAYQGFGYQNQGFGAKPQQVRPQTYSAPNKPSAAAQRLTLYSYIPESAFLIKKFDYNQAKTIFGDGLNVNTGQLAQDTIAGTYNVSTINGFSVDGNTAGSLINIMRSDTESANRYLINATNLNTLAFQDSSSRIIGDPFRGVQRTLQDPAGVFTKLGLAMSGINAESIQIGILYQDRGNGLEIYYVP